MFAFRGITLLLLLPPMIAIAGGERRADMDERRGVCLGTESPRRCVMKQEGTSVDSARRELEKLRVPCGSFWAGLRRVLLPRQLSLIYDLRELITAQDPPDPRTRQTDLQRLDAIYVHAVYLAEGDIALTLFALSVATLPYHTFPARVPLLGWSVTVPVSMESREDFLRRLANLPGLLLADSPPQLDRDKLPHFFGSAWLHCMLRDEDLTMAAGELIEYGEELFKLEGFRDERDLVVNRLGARFADALMRQRLVLPSDFFRNEL